MIPIGRQQHLGKRTLIIMILQGALPGVVLLLLVVGLSFSNTNIINEIGQNIETINVIFPNIGANLQNIGSIFIPLIFFIAILFGCVGIIINALRYHFYVFTLEEFSFKLRKGVLRVEEISIPYRQMQNVDITKPLVYRILGLSRLVVISAGNEQSMEGDQVDTVFDPIDTEIAEKIREILDRRIGVQVIEHETEADLQDAQAKADTANNL